MFIKNKPFPSVTLKFVKVTVKCFFRFSQASAQWPVPSRKPSIFAMQQPVRVATALPPR